MDKKMDYEISLLDYRRKYGTAMHGIFHLKSSDQENGLISPFCVFDISFDTIRFCTNPNSIILTNSSLSINLELKLVVRMSYHNDRQTQIEYGNGSRIIIQGFVLKS